MITKFTNLYYVITINVTRPQTINTIQKCCAINYILFDKNDYTLYNIIQII